MHLIFDFDGTLVDSFDFLMEKFVQVSHQYHIRSYSPEEIAHFRDLSSMEIVKQLKIPLHLMPGLLKQIRQSVQGEILKLNPVDNLFQVLKKLHQAGCTLGILSSNAKENISTWLEHHQMTDVFQFIYIEHNFFAKGAVLKEIIDCYHIDKRQAFYIGDETRDIEAAKENDIYAVAVTWGYNSEKALLQSQPHYIARQPVDLLRICDVNY